MQTAETTWKLLDDANLDYSRRLVTHEQAQQSPDEEEIGSPAAFSHPNLPRFLTLSQQGAGPGQNRS